MQFLQPTILNNEINQLKCYILAFITEMDRQFQHTLKRRTTRERFYSSMNHDEYVQIFGPPSPLFKPQEDPDLQLPLLELQKKCDETQDLEANIEPTPTLYKMETILQIDGSQNHTQHLHQSPRLDLLTTINRSQSFFKLQENPKEEKEEKRMRVRMRSQSDNSEYLIFNFLERVNQNGRKRVKLE